MLKLSAPSYTRVTLALDIVGKIDSGPYAGYHELSIVKHRIQLFDTITIEESDRTELICTHPLVPCDASNICIQALNTLNTICGTRNNVRITLDKNIPVMGGLAGGSANAATTLMLLNTMFKYKLSTADLMNVGRQLGMDVPYYFSGSTAFDTEATGILTHIPTSLSFNFLIVIPDFGVSTRNAYAAIDYNRINKNSNATAAMRTALAANDRALVVASMHNDFELSVFKSHPELASIKKEMLRAGCEQAMMSGSGSTLIGILAKNADVEAVRAALPYTTRIVASHIV